MHHDVPTLAYRRDHGDAKRLKEARRNADQCAGLQNPFQGRLVVPDGLERLEHLLCQVAVEPRERLRPARLLKHGP